MLKQWGHSDNGKENGNYYLWFRVCMEFYGLWGYYPNNGESDGKNMTHEMETGILCLRSITSTAI